MSDTKVHPEVIAALMRAIDACGRHGWRKVAIMLVDDVDGARASPMTIVAGEEGNEQGAVYGLEVLKHQLIGRRLMAEAIETARRGGSPPGTLVE